MDDMTDDAPNGPDPNRWFFDKERLENTPSRKCGIDADKELMLRQQSANFIQDMGQRLHVNQLCINTAIVYMHRFYMYHSFSHFHQNHVSTAAIFLAAKVEEQPRKLEHVIKVAHYCLNRDAPQIDTKSEAYAEQAQELVMTENILLQTLGFDVAIDHPHAHVVKCCQLVRASKDLAQTSYFMATNSLHLTTMCLQYKPTVVACVCIHLTCKWSNWEIPRSKEGKDWFWYVDDSVTIEQLEKLTTEFLAIFDKSPSRLKKKILSLNQGGSGGSSLSLSGYPTLSMDPKSPGNPQSQARSSPATSSHPSNQALKRPSGSMKPSSSQIANKQAKINGGIGHHSMKPPHSSQIPPSNSSKHPHYSSSSGNKGILPHHGAKDAHSMQPPHGKPPPPPGHHSSSSSAHPPLPPNYPHGSSSSSSSSSSQSQSRSSSHSHSMHHGSSSLPHQPSSGQPPKSSTTSSSSSSSHNLPGQQHAPKPPHPQPSKVPYNFNMKSQMSSSSGQPPLSRPPGSSSSSQPPSAPPSSKPHFQPPPYNQIKKPFPDPSRREPSLSDFNGKRESSDDISRRSNSISSQSSSSRSRLDQKPGDSYTSSGGTNSSLPPVSVPLSSSTSATEPPRIWTESGTSSSNTGPIEPRIPPGRTSLFSPDPELMESSSFISSTLQSAMKPELSPIGDLSVGAKGTNSIGDGDSVSDSYFAMPSSVSSSVFPNLFEYSGTTSGRPAADASSTSTSASIFDIKPESSSMPSDNGPGDPSAPSSLLAPTPVPSLSSSSASSTLLPPSSVASLQNSAKTESDSAFRLRLPDNSLHEDEPPHKKVKKPKKEKHKHKDKERSHDEKKERKEKDEKKHKDKNKDRSREDKKHKDKHKKDKHKEKDRDKSKVKYPGEPETVGFGSTDHSGKLKIRMVDSPVGGLVSTGSGAASSIEKSKSKHSSKKHKSSLPSSSLESQPGSAPTGIKLKIVPPRPPPTDDGRL